MTNSEEPPMVAVPAPVLAELLRVASLHPLVQAVGAAQRILKQIPPPSAPQPESERQS
jgi:hypothetical protein